MYLKREYLSTFKNPGIIRTMLDHINTFLTQKNHIFIKNLLFFSGVFFGVFVLSFSLLSVLGFIPTEFEETTNENTLGAKISNTTMEQLGLADTPSTTAPIVNTEAGEAPYRIVSSAINLDATVERPGSKSYSALDTALSKGPVYYPGSGLAGNGNMFIFGHSTGYKIVNNKAYQVFNNIKNLKAGDEVKVYGQDKVYVYKVRDVKLVNATQELVSFSDNANMLTLSTCNSFGQKSDRYVAEADFVESHSI